MEMCVRVVDDEGKMDCLMEFLRNMNQDEKVIIFVGKKNLADHLSSELICKGLECQSLHGDRVIVSLADIKGGLVSILVATDLASRGLVIEDITHVFNYDFPRNIEEYVHRVGRTGHAGRTGVSITLVTRYDWRHSTELVKILEDANQMRPYLVIFSMRLNEEFPWLKMKEVPEQLRRMSDRFEMKKSQGGWWS